MIQPDHVDLEQSTWRRVLDVRDRIAEADADVESIRDDLDALGSIGDATVERAVGNALDALFEGEHDRATEELGSVVWTPCERAEPRRRAVGADHDAACHLHDRTGDTDLPDPFPSDGPISAEGFQWVGDRET